MGSTKWQKGLDAKAHVMIMAKNSPDLIERLKENTNGSIPSIRGWENFTFNTAIELLGISNNGLGQQLNQKGLIFSRKGGQIKNTDKSVKPIDNEGLAQLVAIQYEKSFDDIYSPLEPSGKKEIKKITEAYINKRLGPLVDKMTRYKAVEQLRPKQETYSKSDIAEIFGMEEIELKYFHLKTKSGRYVRDDVIKLYDVISSKASRTLFDRERNRSKALEKIRDDKTKYYFMIGNDKYWITKNGIISYLHEYDLKRFDEDCIDDLQEQLNGYKGQISDEIKTEDLTITIKEDMLISFKVREDIPALRIRHYRR